MTTSSCFVATAPRKPTISELLTQLINQQLNSIALEDGQSATLHFRDSTYSAEIGGFHPVEIGIHKLHGKIDVLYITDFSFTDNATGELTKDLDFDFGNQVAFARYSGWHSIDNQEIIELYELWEHNFLAYVEMSAFDDIQAHHSKAQSEGSK